MLDFFLYIFYKFTHYIKSGVKMKIKKRLICIICLLLLSVSFFSNIGQVYADNFVYLGGFPAGFSITTKGAHVVGLCDVITTNGIISPSKNAELKSGDVIINLDGKEVNCAKDIENILKSENQIFIEIKRQGELIKKLITPAKDLSGAYKLGIFIKDDVCGIGTVTYVNGGRLASLGHPVIDDNGQPLDIINGFVYPCNITGYIKGEKGKAGELRGVFLKENELSYIDKNLESGVFGNISQNLNIDQYKKIELGSAKIGEATIFTTIDGKIPKEYKISIVKVDTHDTNKNFVIKITDKELLESTGGIIQGMSGSPIVQNNKLVGAVTHVFVNDPTRGFGISITNMINN